MHLKFRNRAGTYKNMTFSVFFWWWPPKKTCDEQQCLRAAYQKRGLCFSLKRWFLWAPEWKSRAKTYNNIPLSAFFGDVFQKKNLQFKHQCAASSKWGPCFPLARWFLWVPERKNRARTYNDLCFLVMSPKKKNLRWVWTSMHSFSQMGPVFSTSYMVPMSSRM